MKVKNTSKKDTLTTPKSTASRGGAKMTAKKHVVLSPSEKEIVRELQCLVREHKRFQRTREQSFSEGAFDMSFSSLMRGFDGSASSLFRPSFGDSSLVLPELKDKESSLNCFFASNAFSFASEMDDRWMDKALVTPRQKPQRRSASLSTPTTFSKESFDDQKIPVPPCRRRTKQRSASMYASSTLPFAPFQ